MPDAISLDLMIFDVEHYLKSRQGCIDIQKKIENDPLIYPATVLMALAPSFASHCIAPYGNYVCQKLLGHVSDLQLLRILEMLDVDMLPIATNIHGACFLKCLIQELAGRAEQSLLLNLFARSLLSIIPCLVNDPHGALVIQHFFTFISASAVHDPIVEYIRNNFTSIVTDRYGCCLVKKVLESKTGKSLSEDVMQHVLVLIKVSSRSNSINQRFRIDMVTM